jgi:hypothetical protein
MRLEENKIELLSKKIDDLENQNRVMKKSLLAFAIIGCLFLTIGITQKNQIIEAQGFVLKDAKGQIQAELSSSQYGTSFNIYNREGRSILVLREATTKGGSISLNNQEGISTVFLMSEGNDGSININPKADIFPSTSLTKRGLLVLNKDSQVALGIGETELGLRVVDAQGFQTVIGNIGLEKPLSGEIIKTSAASITLFSKDKKVIWKAP